MPRLLAAIVLLAVTLVAGATRIGPAPALGAFLDPAHGVWSMARATFEMAYLLTVDGVRVCTAITGHAVVSAADGSVQRLPAWLKEFGSPSAEKPLYPRTTAAHREPDA